MTIVDEGSANGAYWLEIDTFVDHVVREIDYWRGFTGHFGHCRAILLICDA